MSNKDVKQDALDNLADALTEDILNTPDDVLLREVEEDYGDPHALANKFDQLLERAKQQASGSASSPSHQVPSPVLGSPISLTDETLRWVKGFFGSRLSEFLSSLTLRTLAWSATTVVGIALPTAVITAVVVTKQVAPSGEMHARGAIPPLAGPIPEAAETRVEPQQYTPAAAAGQPGAATAHSSTELVPSSPKNEKIAALVAGGRQLIVAGDIPNARLVLQQAAEYGNATAALELGATYDPTMLQQKATTDMADVTMARLWYEKARDLGSTEAAVRLEQLRNIPSPGR